MAKSKHKKVNRGRNWLAVGAFQRGGAGRHPDRKKQASKRACRGRVVAD